MFHLQKIWEGFAFLNKGFNCRIFPKKASETFFVILWWALKQKNFSFILFTFVLLPENLHTYFEISAQAWTLYKAP